tara:strand:+ start:4611 stop:7874 length:3264 start_codon:yes stop_codon:yes gene_type:complete
MAATIQTIQTPKRAKALDTSGNNNHGQIYSGRALEFDGVSDHLTCITRDALEEFTVAVWINVNAISARHHITGSSSNNAGKYIGINIAGTNYDLQWYNGSEWQQGGIALNINTWYRLVYIFKKNGSAGDYKVYINGVEDTTGDFPSEGAGSYTNGTFSFVGSNSGTERFFDGMMSDLQIWNTSWTQSDITYDYLNPESLSLNNGGTSLTESNLKLWYPMQDGHRGQQSHILDASNVGLGDELGSNMDFSLFDTAGDASHGDSPTGWLIFNENANNYYTEIPTGIRMTMNEGGAGNTDLYMSQSGTLVVGIMYRAEVKITAITGSNRLRFYTGDTNIGDFSTIGVHYAYYMQTTGTAFILAKRGTSGGVIDIEYLKVQAVNAKNHATTVFEGEELITDTKNKDFGSSSDWAVLNIAGGSLTEPSNRLQVVTSTDEEVEGAQLAVGELNAAPVVGRVYRIRAKLDNTSGATTPTIQFRIGGGTAVNVTATDDSPNDGTIDTTEQEYYADVIATNTTGAVIIQNVASTSSTTFTIDDISVKELGQAAGWTEADQQLDIPQTALQSYNQLAWFDGKNDYVAIAGSNAAAGNVADFGTDNFTLSAWVYLNNQAAISTERFIFSRYEDADKNWKLAYNYSNKRFVVTIRDHLGGTNIMGHSGAAIPSDMQSSWIHVALSMNRSGNANLYINGSTEQYGKTHDIASRSTVSIDNDGVLGIGGRGDAGSSGICGCVTEAAVFDGIALSSAQVLELYNDGIALDVTTHSQASTYLTGYWRNKGFSTWENLIVTSNVTTANEAIDATETVITVSSGTNIEVNDSMLIDNEKMLVSSKSTNDITVVRGHGGTIATTHDNSSNISLYRNGTVNGTIESLLLPAGVDGSRDSQGLFMNRQRTTNSLNLLSSYDDEIGTHFGYVETNTVLNHDVFSISCWFKPSILGQNHYFVDNRSGTDEGWLLYSPGSDSSIRFKIGDGTDHIIVTSGGKIALDTWVHIAATYSGSAGTISTYINGVAGNTGTADAGNTAGGGGDVANLSLIADLALTTMTIGRKFRAGTDNKHGAQGELDDVFYYDDVLLVGEIKRIYNAGKRSHRNG